MARLTINPDTPEAFDWPLKPGINTLGRSADNDLPIEHESVAERHCEIHLGEAEATLLDLGSANGTRVDGQRVEQVVLRDGQPFMVGQVAIRFWAAPEVGSSAENSETEPALPAGQCRYHPKSPARYFCPQCAKAYCGLCVGRRAAPGQPVVTCRQCGSACTEVAGAAVEEVEPPSFRELAVGAFQYPLRGGGWVLLAAGTVFYALLGLLQIAPFVGLLVVIFGAGYLAAYLQKIVAASAMGEDHLPPWPDFQNLQEDILAPLFQLAGVILFCLAPAIAAGLFLPETPAGRIVTVAAWVLGVAYLPMALLAVCMADHLGALNPALVIPAVIRLRGQYWLVCTLLVAAVVTSQLLQVVLEKMLPIPLVPSLVSGFVSLYFLVVQMRLLGSMHWCNRQRLGWVKG